MLHTQAILGHTLDSQALKQYISQWSRVLRSGGLNHSKSLCVLEFSPFIPTIKQNA
jgi:ubiquinone/menaquinone biosynthesis C-methylase UbiE